MYLTKMRIIKYNVAVKLITSVFDDLLQPAKVSVAKANNEKIKREPCSSDLICN